MKRKKLKIILILFFALILCWNMKTLAKSQELNSLDFDVTLESNGDMKVVETWDVSLYDTNTLFKTFSSSPSGFKDVSVKEITNGINNDYRNVNQLQYYVDKGGYYALKNSKGDFEIAWNVDTEGTRATKKYQISYTVNNIIFLYNDCAELYWQFIGKDFSIPIKRLTGTIKLPNSVADIEQFRVWAHGPLTGEITKEGNDIAKFVVSNVSKNTMIEVRIATPTSIFETSANVINKNKLDSIISEETAWANDANSIRRRAQEQLKDPQKVTRIIVAVVSLIGIFSFIKTGEVIQKNPKKVPTQELEYCRNIPNEDATPGEAEFLYRFGKSFETGKVFSATLLDLSLKKLISFEEIEGSKNNINLIIHTEETQPLKEDERKIFEFIKRAAGIDGKISMKEFKKYCERNDVESYMLWQRIEKIAKENNKQNGNFDSSIANKRVTYSFLTAIWIFIAIVSLITLNISKTAIFLIIIAFLNTVASIIAADRLKGLTQKGIDEREKWEGLRNFMLDFSLLDEKRVPDLVLWEKYLVYATAFGIADKVLKQLRVYFPQLQNDEYFRTHYASMYYCNHYNVGKSFESSIYSGYSAHVAEIAASSMSSGSGGGGGFSSGGGGRLRWWRRWWSLITKSKKKLEKTRKKEYR